MNKTDPVLGRRQRRKGEPEQVQEVIAPLYQEPGAPPERRRFIPTTSQRLAVAIGIACGESNEDIRRYIDGDHEISAKTFTTAFAEEIERGRGIALAAVAKRVFRDALFDDGPVGARSRFFVLERLGGWITPDQAPVVPARQMIVNFNMLSRDERDELRRLVARTLGPAAGGAGDA